MSTKKVATLKKQILDYIRERGGGVTYAELSALPGVSGGDIAQCSSKYENLVYWTGLTEEGSAAISELVRDGRVTRQPTAFLTYLIDGQTLRMPLVKAARSYKRPHWCPVAFYPAEARP